ncbi:LacI family DNA-binding transcriptional regulator [Alteromonas genovensis]|jgi:LacI family transcriptional regulator|uniref:LacI family DNA-binding transcriptional regulator n=1 Tax=Alteromonas genovensis TaxID=471225 RepID=A0A6N9TLR0_9ALTE|nr:LacI family DNA-binding transcriptional regulator [Alteromonas genovensis]NDW17075.1 LacI family DNA-binding transcriptional regulator [Alteromonas genovensis]
MTTIYEVAARAGVSLSTVSRVLNGKASVNAAMADKVKQAASELHYTPSQKARSLASKHSHAVGVVLPNKHMLFSSHLLFSFEHILRQYQKHCVVAFSHDTLESENEAIEFLLSQGCDGVFVNTIASPSIASTTKHLQDKKHSVVTLSQSELKGGVTGFSTSIFEVAAYAFKQLRDLGHNDIALISDNSELVSHTNEISVALKSALSRLSVSGSTSFRPELSIYVGSEGTDDPLLELLAKETAFSAVICTSDALVKLIVTSAKELGMELPNDLSIIAAQAPDSPLKPAESPLSYRVSTVAYSTLDIAKVAASYCLSSFYEQATDESTSHSALPTSTAPIFLDYGSTASFT